MYRLGFNCTSYQVPARRGGPFSLLLAFLRLPQPEWPANGKAYGNKKPELPSRD